MNPNDKRETHVHKNLKFFVVFFAFLVFSRQAIRDWRKWRGLPRALAASEMGKEKQFETSSKDRDFFEPSDDLLIIFTPLFLHSFHEFF